MSLTHRRRPIGSSIRLDCFCGLSFPSLARCVRSLCFSVPCSVRGKERGRNLSRVSGEAVGCPVRTTEEKAPDGRILHPAMALTGRNSYISPEPKRCVERKALNCLARIIAQFPPDSGIRMQNIRAGESKPPPLLPWKGPALPLYHTASPRRNLTRGRLDFAKLRPLGAEVIQTALGLVAKNPKVRVPYYEVKRRTFGQRPYDVQRL